MLFLTFRFCIFSSPYKEMRLLCCSYCAFSYVRYANQQNYSVTYNETRIIQIQFMMDVGFVFLCFIRLPEDGIAVPKHVEVENHHELYFMIRISLFSNFIWRNSPQWARASSFTRFLDHTQRRATVGRTPLDEDQLVAETST